MGNWRISNRKSFVTIKPKSHIIWEFEKKTPPVMKSYDRFTHFWNLWLKSYAKLKSTFLLINRSFFFKILFYNSKNTITNTLPTLIDDTQMYLEQFLKACWAWVIVVITWMSWKYIFTPIEGAETEVNNVGK